MPIDVQALVTRISALSPEAQAQVARFVDGLFVQTTAVPGDRATATGVGGDATSAPPSEADRVQEEMEAATAARQVAELRQ